MFHSQAKQERVEKNEFGLAVMERFMMDGNVSV
jgi:hypothetical protein